MYVKNSQFTLTWLTRSLLGLALKVNHDQETDSNQYIAQCKKTYELDKVLKKV